MTLNGNTLSGIKLSGTAVNAANYTILSDTVTFKKAYLSTLTNGDNTFTFDFSAGTDPTFAITVSDTTPLTNVAAPTISAQPQNKTVNVNGTAELSVTASGVSLSYQWYSNTTNSTTGATEISSATGSTYSAPTGTAGEKYYYCVVTNTDSSKTGTKTATVTTDIVKVTVNALTNAAEPAISAQPQGKTVNVNGTAELSVTASGVSLSYQWYSNTTNSTTGATEISSATGSTYCAPTGTAGEKYYYCVVTNTDNSKTGNKTATITTDIAKVTVNALTNAADPTISAQPQNKTVNVNGTAELSVTASGVSLSYQWYSNTTNSITGATEISSATGSTYSAPTGTAGEKYYYCVVTNTDSSKTGTKTATVTTDIVKVTVSSSPSTTRTVTFDKNDGDTEASPLTMTVTSGEELGSLPTPPIRANYVFAGWKDNGGNSFTAATSVNSNITVFAQWAVYPIISTAPVNQSATVGSTATFSVSVTPITSAAGILTYQWQKCVSGGSWTNIVGAISLSYTTGTLLLSDNGTQYRCIVSNTFNNTTANINSISGILTVTAGSGSSSSSSSSKTTTAVTESKTITVIEAPQGITNPEMIKVEPQGNAFDQSVEVRLKEDPIAKQTVLDAVKEKLGESTGNAAVFPIDISLYIKGTNTKVQPNSGTSVQITCPIPAALLADKDKIVVASVVDGKLQILPAKVVLVNNVYCIIFTANHFSPYAFVIDSDGSLLSLAAGAGTFDSEIPISQNGLPYLAVSIGLTILAIVVSVKKKTKIRK